VDGDFFTGYPTIFAKIYFEAPGLVKWSSRKFPTIIEINIFSLDLENSCFIDTNWSCLNA